MLNETDLSRLSAALDSLVSENAQGDGNGDLAGFVADLKESLRSGTSISPVPQAVNDDVIPYPPFVAGGADNLGPTQDEHDLAFVKKVCQRCNHHVRRARKALRLESAAIFVFWRNINPHSLAELVQKELGEKFSHRKSITLTIRLCNGLKNLPGTDPEIREANKANNDFVNYQANIIHDLDAAFRNHPVRLEDLGLIVEYLSNRDHRLNKIDTRVKAQIVADPRQPNDDSEDQPNDDSEDQPEEGGEEESGSDEDGAEQGADCGEEDDPSEPPQPMTKAQRMLLGAPEVPLDTLLERHCGPGALVMVAFAGDADGISRPIGALPCEGASAKTLYETIQADGPSPVAAMFCNLVGVMPVLTTASNLSASSTEKKPAFEPASPAMVITVGSDGVVADISASASETAGTVMVKITPTTETKVGPVSAGQFIDCCDWHGVPVKAITDALATNDALVRLTPNANDAFDAIITVPRLPETLLSFFDYDTGDLRVSVPDYGRLEFTTELLLSPERLRHVREFWAVPFLAGGKAKQRLQTIMLAADDEIIVVKHAGRRRVDKQAAEVVLQGGDVAEILALDFFLAIDSITRIGTDYPVSIKITSDGVVGIRAFTEHSQIEVVIPPVIDGSLVRTDTFTVPLMPAAQEPAAHDPEPAKDNLPLREPASTAMVPLEQEDTAAPQADQTMEETAAPEPAKALPKRRGREPSASDTTQAKSKRMRPGKDKTTTSQPEAAAASPTDDKPADAAPKRRRSRASKNSV
jgi:hypothetical protein